MSNLFAAPRSTLIAIAPASNNHDTTNAPNSPGGDKIIPSCTTCRKARPRLDCIYQSPAPRKRKRKPVDDVHERLDRYETILRNHGLLPTDTPRSSADPSPPANNIRVGIPASADRNQELKTGRLLPTGRTGKTRYVESNMWKNLSDDELEPSSDDGEDDDHIDRGIHAMDPLSSSILGPLSPVGDLVHLHPTYEAACKLWTVYVEYIDPICKIVHVPTGRDMVQHAASDPSLVSKPTEALLFSIYHFAVRVLTEAECGEFFGQRRSTLLSTYHDAFRHSLVRASFLRTTDPQVLQAFTLFLLAVRGSYDPQTFWILTGVGVRMAQRIGLHRDGEDLGLNPFDVQIRRRLFWQLLPLDGMASNLCGTGLPGFSDRWDTRQPLNIEDEDIWPGMKSTPVERKGATGMIFCLVRSFFHQRRAQQWTAWDGAAKDDEATRQAMKQVDDLEASVEDRFLKYIDPFVPVQCLASAMARGGLTFARMRLRLARARLDGASKLEPNEREELFKGALWFLDYMSTAFRNAVLLKFRWHFTTFFQWEPLVWVLSELRARAPRVDPMLTWPKVELTFEDHPELFSRRRALHIAVGKLTLKAWDLNPSVPPNMAPPYYITTLRSSCSKRDRHSSHTESADPPPNVLPPRDDASTDPPVPDYFASATNGNLDLEAMDDLNPDSIDWAFWDQLIRDPNALLMDTTSTQ